MPFLAALLPALPTIIIKMISAYDGKLKADADRVIADRNARRDERIERGKAVAGVLAAEGGRSILNPLMRAYIAIGPATYLFKIFVFDKVVCPAVGWACSTDQLSPELWDVVGKVVGFYLVAETTLGVGRAIAGALVRKK